jgi:acylphosphatase
MTEGGDSGAGPIRRRVRVHGRVQGVWFRAATREEARRQGVSGWVRNRPDGSVEAVFEGPAAAVEALLAFVGRGPPGARVTRVEVEEQTPRGERDFAIER